MCMSAVKFYPGVYVICGHVIRVQLYTVAEMFLSCVLCDFVHNSVQSGGSFGLGSFFLSLHPQKCNCVSLSSFRLI